MKKTRVLIADDHEVVRRGVRAMVEALPEWEICGEASNGRDAVSAAERLHPDIVVMDISMPGLNGIEATRQIHKANPRIEILVLSMHESEQLVRDLLDAGARGYVLKVGVGRDLIAALEALREHRPYFTSRIAEVVLQGYLHGSQQPPGAAHNLLSTREREIVQLIAEGKPNKEVAALLNISVKTVETHRAHIMEKLDLHSVSDLVRWAIRNQLIDS